MKPVIDLSKEYGIVLEGGGAKGAYQIGAWRALRESGVKICAIAGTSVGALNGALMCMGDYENAKQVWENISYSKVMDVDDEKMSQVMQGTLPLGQWFEATFQTMKDGGMDITPLKQLIAEHVDAGKIIQSPIDFYVLTFCMDDRKEFDLNVKEVAPATIPDLLLASAYIFPLFKNDMKGKKFIDGGVINNVPLGSLVDRGYKNIIMLRIFGVGREKKVKIPEGTTIYSVEPRINLGNMIDFNGEKSKRHMRLGYYDAMRMIYGLSGSIYYIDEEYDETEYLRKLCSIYSGKSLRKYIEFTLPALACELKLSTGWNYKELYLSMIEASAKFCRIPKYKIYTLEELETLLEERGDRMKEYDRIPAFAKLLFHQEEEEEDEPERT